MCRGGSFECTSVSHVSERFAIRCALATYHNTHKPNGEDDNSKHGNDEVNPLLSCPSIDEEADWENHTTRHGQNRSKTGLGSVSESLLLIPDDNEVGERAEGADTDHHTDTGGKESETDGALVEAVLIPIDEGEGRDEEVEDTVCDGDVESHKSDDRCDEEELYRSDDGVLELVLRGLAIIELASEVRVASFLAEPGYLAFENERGESLLHHEPRERNEDTTLQLDQIPCTA